MDGCLPFQYVTPSSKTSSRGLLTVSREGDLVMWFGSYPEGEGAPTKLEGQASATMGELLLSFVTDPYNGPEALGWPAFDPTARDGGTMLRFGADGKTVQKVAANDVQAVCTDPSASYDHSP